MNPGESRSDDRGIDGAVAGDNAGARGIIGIKGAKENAEGLGLVNLPPTKRPEDDRPVDVSDGYDEFRDGLGSFIAGANAHGVGATLEKAGCPHQFTGNGIESGAGRQTQTAISDGVAIHVKGTKCEAKGSALRNGARGLGGNDGGLIDVGHEKSEEAFDFATTIGDPDTDALVSAGGSEVGCVAQHLFDRIEDGTGGEITNDENEGVAVGVSRANGDDERRAFSDDEVRDRQQDRRRVHAGDGDVPRLKNRAAASIGGANGEGGAGGCIASGQPGQMTGERIE